MPCEPAHIAHSEFTLLCFVWLCLLLSSSAVGQTLPSGFQESAVLSGLNAPTAFQFAQDGRIFVAQKSGTILVFQNLNDTNPTVFADLSSEVDNSGDRGLLGLGLDPNFPNLPYVYVFYTYPSPTSGGRLSRLQANGNIMTGVEQILIQDWYQQYPDNPVGNIAFGPDGALYAAAGDGASASFVDTGQTEPTGQDPPGEGGALRSQRLQIPFNPITLDGSVVRVQPNTGQPLPQNTSMIVGTPTVDGNGVKYYPVTSAFQGAQQLTVRVLEPTNPVSGRPRRFLYVLPVEAGLTNLNSTFSDGLEELRLLDVQDRFNLTLIAPSFNYEPWYGDNVTDETFWMESFIIRELVPFGDSFATDGQIPQRFVIGFSKSGNGALSIAARHPNVFSEAAAWDAPAQLSNCGYIFPNSVNFGTQANFALYNIPTLVATNNAPFTQINRLWISGDQSLWTADMVQLNSQMNAALMLHTWVAGGSRQDTWGSGWLDGAVTSLDANATLTSPVDTQMSGASLLMACAVHA